MKFFGNVELNSDTGENSGKLIYQGSKNILIGDNVLSQNVSGDNNIVIGADGLSTIQGGTDNISIGSGPSDVLGVSGSLSIGKNTGVSLSDEYPASWLTKGLRHKITYVGTTDLHYLALPIITLVQSLLQLIGAHILLLLMKVEYYF